MKKRRKLSPEPQQIDEHNWYYEYPDGITVIHEIWQGEQYFKTDEFKIPNRLLKHTFVRLFPELSKKP